MRLVKGDIIPDFTFSTAYEQNRSFYSALKGKTVLWVLRYIGCPMCRLDMHDIAQNYSSFTEKNTQVFVVMQSDAEHLKKELTDTPVPFEIISDPEYSIYHLFEIEPATNMLALAGNPLRAAGKLRAVSKAGFKHGDYEGIETQLPAVFVLDETGKVLYAHYARNLTDMPSVQEILELL